MSNEKETQAILRESQVITDLVGNDGWETAKSHLMEELGKVNSLVNIPKSLRGEEFVIEAEARRIAVEMVMTWIQDIEGVAKQNDDLQDSFIKIEKDVIISQFE